MNMLMAQPGAAFTNGFNQAGQIREQKKQNSLAELFRTQGSDIAAGNPAAMNALAQLDPMAARGISRENAADARVQQSFEMQQQSHGQSMQIGKMQIDKIRQDSKLQAEQHAANMTAQERAAEAAQIASVTSAAAAAYRQGPDAFSAYIQGMAPQIQQAGIDPAQITYESFPAYAAGLVGLREGLEAGIAAGEGFVPDAPKPADEYGRYVAEEEAAGRQPLSRIDYAQAKKGTETVFGPDGKPILQRGPSSSAPKKLTERQSQLALFGSMMSKTMPVINDLEGRFDPSNIKDNVVGRVFGGNFAKSQEMQKYEAAGRAWAEGVLRIQTGAAATQSEIDRVFETYFAQIGDTAETITYKRELRDAFAESIGVAGGGAVEVPGGAQARSSAKPASGDNPFTGMTPEALSKIDIQSLTGEQIDQLFEATMK